MMVFLACPGKPLNHPAVWFHKYYIPEMRGQKEAHLLKKMERPASAGFACLFEEG
jgi:hypothetical protein